MFPRFLLIVCLVCLVLLLRPVEAYISPRHSVDIRLSMRLLSPRNQIQFPSTNFNPTTATKKDNNINNNSNKDSPSSTSTTGGVIPYESYPIKIEANKVSFRDENDNEIILLNGIDSTAFQNDDIHNNFFNSITSSSHSHMDDKNGMFVSFKFPALKSQHDARIGLIPKNSKLVAYSRIKRWWMAPSFHNNGETVPVETQLLLVEIDTSLSTLETLSNNMKSTFSSHSHPPHHQDEQSISHKKYALVAPLIDFNRGFRATIYGKEGGTLANRGNLAVRIESGDPLVQAIRVDDALYIAAGNDPYKLISDAYSIIAKRMGTFRTRQQKLPPQGIDSFGFCTWDAFYSSVNSQNVLKGVESLSNIGFPPRFLIIDDGWQSTTGNRPKKKKYDENDDNSNNALINGTMNINTADTITPSTSLMTTVTSTVAATKKPSSITTSITTSSPNNNHIDTKERQVPDSLTGQPIDGAKASQELATIQNSPMLKLVVKLATSFYTEVVEKGKPDSWSVKLWSLLSHTVLKERLIEFFAMQTDFSKRLTSWKANSKFENPEKGMTLKGLVNTLKTEKGINYVFVWHALAGYWGGVSEDEDDDFPRELNSNENKLPTSALLNLTNLITSATTVMAAVSHSPQITQLNQATSSHTNTHSPRNLMNATAAALRSNSLKSTNTNVLPTKVVKRSYSKPTPHLLLVEPALNWDPSSLAGVGSVALDKLEEMYYRMYSYLRDSGIDGVKVDAQSGIGSFGLGNGGGSNIARACVTAMETNVRLFFGNDSSILTSIANISNTMNNTLNTNAANVNTMMNSNYWSLLPSFRSLRNRLTFPATESILTNNDFVDNIANGNNNHNNHNNNDGSNNNNHDTNGLFSNHNFNSNGMNNNKRRSPSPDSPFAPLSLVGCMCHSTENLLNFYETSLARVSDDFYPKDVPSQTVHLASCAYNSVMIGEIAIADWDMFHSSHPAAEMHAAARSISGGPLYVSDSPGNHNATLLRKLVLNNGRVLRTQLPARPTVDCLFSDVMRDGHTAMKIWSTNKVNAVVGAFNIQGSSWDKSLRKYVSHVQPQQQHAAVVVADIRPRDVSGDFSLPVYKKVTTVTTTTPTSTPVLSPASIFSFTHSSSTAKTSSSSSSSSSKQLKQQQIDQQAENEANNKNNMFIVWSARDKAISLLSNRNSAIKVNLKPREWDIVSFARVRRIRIKRKSIFGIATRGSSSRSSSSSSNNNDDNGDDDDDSMNKDIRSSGNSITTTTTTTSSNTISADDAIDRDYDEDDNDLSPFQKAVAYQHPSLNSINLNLEKKRVLQQMDTKQYIYWCAVGLLDMFNCGGAVEEVEDSHEEYTSSISGLTSGVGGGIKNTVLSAINSVTNAALISSSSSSSSSNSNHNHHNTVHTTGVDNNTNTNHPHPPVSPVAPIALLNTASITSRGPGLFGVYTSHRPKRVLIDGVEVTDFTYSSNENSNNSGGNSNSNSRSDNKQRSVRSSSSSSSSSNNHHHDDENIPKHTTYSNSNDDINDNDIHGINTEELPVGDLLTFFIPSQGKSDRLPTDSNYDHYHPHSTTTTTTSSSSSSHAHSSSSSSSLSPQQLLANLMDPHLISHHKSAAEIQQQTLQQEEKKAALLNDSLRKITIIW